MALKFSQHKKRFVSHNHGSRIMWTSDHMPKIRNIELVVFPITLIFVKYLIGVNSNKIIFLLILNSQAKNKKIASQNAEGLS